MRQARLLCLPACLAVFMGGMSIAQRSPDTSASLAAPAVLAGTVIPPTTERTLVFSDRGRTYLVGLQSGRVSFVDGSGPLPVIPTPGPVIPPGVPLTGLAKAVHDGLMSSPIEPQNRVLGAKALAGAIDSTLGEIGGLGIEDCQAIIDRLATNAEAARVNEYLRGWQLGTLLAGEKIATKDQLLQALTEIRKGLESIR